MDELIHELKSQGVLKSPYIEAAFQAIDRRDFVRPEFLSEAYGNYPLPIDAGQTISQPYTVAFMLDLLDPKPGEKILDIGSGSGWTTALLAYCVSEQGGIKSSKLKVKNNGRVFAVERIPELCKFGEANVAKYNFTKKKVVKFFCRDGAAGLPEETPFDKILASAAAFDKIPSAWQEQLKTGGSIVAPIGNSVWRFYKKNGEWEKTQYPGFVFVPLIRDHKSEIGGQKESERKTYETCEIQPRKHSRKKMLVWLGAAAAVAIGYAAYAAYVPIGIENQRVKLEIQKGDGLRIISRKLYDRGVIRSPWIFTAYTTLIGKNRLLKPGSYEFGPRVTMAEVVSRLVGGATDETIITIPEGWNLIDIGRYLEKSGLVTAKEFWDAAGLQTQKYSAAQNPLAQEFLNQFPFLAEKPKTVGLEGYLYPDTYRLYRGSSAKNIIEKMLINFNRKITPELKEKILSQDKTIFEVLTMASLLENEVRSLEDKKLVAGILWKRLSAGIPLQVDASVNYVTGKRETPSGQDIKIKSPYNTYTFPGLPTGPISNPSIESIQAALEAVPGPYLYYLSAPDGRTVYSKTLGQHEAAKAKYLNK